MARRWLFRRILAFLRDGGSALPDDRVLLAEVSGNYYERFRVKLLAFLMLAYSFIIMIVMLYKSCSYTGRAAFGDCAAFKRRSKKQKCAPCDKWILLPPTHRPSAAHVNSFMLPFSSNRCTFAPLQHQIKLQLPRHILGIQVVLNSLHTPRWLHQSCARTLTLTCY